MQRVFNCDVLFCSAAILILKQLQVHVKHLSEKKNTFACAEIMVN